MASGSSDELWVDGWLVDATGHRLVRDSDERRLEPRVVDVLLALARRPGTVVARDDLKREVWGDTFVSDDAVSATVIKLRRALGDSARNPRVVQTVAKSGYRLVGDLVSRSGHPVGADDRREPAVRVGTVVHVRLDLERDDAGPELWQHAHNEVVALVDAEARRCGGWCVAEPGSVLVVVGVPRAREDHVARAVRCASAVAAGVDGRTVEGVRLQVRCGVVPGELVVMEEGSVSGAAVQQARDLATHGAPGDVLLSEDAAEALGPGTWEPVGGVRRFVTAPVPDSTWDVRQRRGLSPLVGRVPDLAVLEQLADQADDGLGQVVVLSGDPGVGKSRLVHELRARLEARGWSTSLGSTSSLDPHSPYVALRRLLNDAGTQAASDSAAWGAVMSPELPDPGWQELDPVVRQQRVAEMALELVVPGDRPCLVAIEDAHWADEATRTLISQICDRIARRRCLLLITTRPSGEDRWSDRSHGTRRRVGPLFPDEAVILLDSLVGDDPGLADWKRDVLDRSAGTPLFVEECVRAASSRDRAPGDARQAVPRSLRGLLAERVDALAPDARAVVARAAVLGRTGSTALLRSLVDLDDAAFVVALDAATRSEILRPLRLRDGSGWEFSHALLQEAAYAGIPRDARRDIHRAVVEQLARDSGAATAGRAAWHLTEADDAPEAVAAWLRAARSAAAATAYEDALAHLGRAGQLVDRLPAADRAAVELRIALATGTASVQTEGPTGSRTRQAFDDAVRLADDCGSAEQRFEAVWGSWFVVMHSGDLLEMAALADELWTLVPELEDSALVLEAHHVQWSGLLLLGRTEDALRHARAALALYRPEEHHRLTYSYGGHDPGVCARNLAALALWLRGEDDESRALSSSAIELAAELAHPYSQIEGCHTALTVAAVEGRVDDLARHVTVLERLLDEGLVPEAARGYVDGFRGALARAEGHADEALRLFAAGAQDWRGFWGAWCLPLDTVWAETLLDVGEPAAAAEVLDAAQQLADLSHAPWWDAEILRMRSRMPNQSPDQIRELLERAAQAGSACGSPRLVARAVSAAAHD